MVFGSPNSYEERILTRSGWIELFVFGMILSGAAPLAVFFVISISVDSISDMLISS